MDSQTLVVSAPAVTVESHVVILLNSCTVFAVYAKLADKKCIAHTDCSTSYCVKHTFNSLSNSHFSLSLS